MKGHIAKRSYFQNNKSAESNPDYTVRERNTSEYYSIGRMRLFGLVYLILTAGGICRAGETAVLASGARLHVDRHEVAEGKVRLFTGSGYIEMDASQVTAFRSRRSAAGHPAPPRLRRQFQRRLVPYRPPRPAAHSRATGGRRRRQVRAAAQAGAQRDARGIGPPAGRGFAQGGHRADAVDARDGP